MENAVRQPDLAKSVQWYQLAVHEAKARLNLAVCPDTWLMLAQMVINTESTVWCPFVFATPLKDAVVHLHFRPLARISLARQWVWVYMRGSLTQKRSIILVVFLLPPPPLR